MSLYSILFIGMLAGLTIRHLFPRIAPPDCIISLLLGAAGALFAACLGKFAGTYAETGVVGISGSIFGAIAVLPLGQQFRGPH